MADFKKILAACIIDFTLLAVFTIADTIGGPEAA
jgi:hypothetical protein